MSISSINRIPALSIRQPWAELIVAGQKTIEIRHWTTEYRGLFWVHVAHTGDAELESSYGMSNLFRGGYLGSAVLRAVIPLDAERWQAWRPRHLDRAEYRTGFYAWLLSSPIRFDTPIAGPGRLSLFYPSIEHETLLNQAAHSFLQRRELRAAASV